MEYIRYCTKCGAEKVYKTLDSYRVNSESLLCRSCARKDVFKKVYPNKVYKLLEDSSEAYYWIGYILSDGHIEKDKRIVFTQCNDDVISVENFSKFIEYSCGVKYKNNKAIISIMNSDIVGKLIKKFDIKSDKTYNPPNDDIFENMNIDLLAYLFIGFVDGDGSIKNLHNRKDFHLRIKVHSSWLNILSIMERRLFGTSTHTKINGQGYAMFEICDTSILKQFKIKYLKDLSFQPLKRKWDIIDLEYVGKYELSKINYKKICELYNKGYSAQQICNELKLKSGVVYKNIRKIKKENSNNND